MGSLARALLLPLLLLSSFEQCLLVGAFNETSIFDWDIEPSSGIQITGISKEIVFGYRIPLLSQDKQCGFQVLDKDCQLQPPSDSYADSIYVSSVDTSQDYSLLGGVSIDVNTIQSSNYYTEIDPYRGSVEFCARVDCFHQDMSVNFHEAKIRIGFDFTVGFAIEATLTDMFSRFKTLYSYKLSFYKTDGNLSDESLRVFEVAASMFLSKELNYWFRELMNPVQIGATVLSQEMITKQVLISRLLQASLLRRLQEYETWTGSKLEIGLNATFDSEPAPSTDEVNEAQQWIWLNNADYFLGNLSAILSICGSELADISETEMETAKDVIQEDYVDGDLVNSTLVNRTVNSALANMTYEELLFAEAAISVCGNLTELENITEVVSPPEVVNPTGTRIFASVSLGASVDAFFCDAGGAEVPAPVPSQGDSIRVCVTHNDSVRFHVEDIYSMTLSQPSTGVAVQSSVTDGQPSSISSKVCQLGLCSITTQVTSRFFTPDAGPIRIVGVAILNLGPADRRYLTAVRFDTARQLSGSSTSGTFQLEAKVRTPLIAGSSPTSTTKNANRLVIVIGSLVLVIAGFVCFALRRRTRKVRSAHTSLEHHSSFCSTPDVRESDWIS